MKNKGETDVMILFFPLVGIALMLIVLLSDDSGYNPKIAELEKRIESLEKKEPGYEPGKYFEYVPEPERKYDPNKKWYEQDVDR